MNCPSRTDEPFDAGYNQNPPHLSSDLTTTADLNGIVNTRSLRRISNELQPEEISSYQTSVIEPSEQEKGTPVSTAILEESKKVETSEHIVVAHGIEKSSSDDTALTTPSLLRHFTTTKKKLGKFFRRQDSSKDHEQTSGNTANRLSRAGCPSPQHQNGVTVVQKIRNSIIKYMKFIGPGFMVSVAYIDPGNYSTDISAGATYRFKLLFVILMSNIFAVFLQSLCIKLGTVTGLNLAENCKAHCPKWLNIFLYILAEVAIIATDIAEVIGTAIALNLLTDKIPLVAGCALSILDVFLILLFYRPNGSMKGLHAFEIFVAVLVLGVVVSFCLELSLIKHVSVGEVFRGYLPSSAIVESQGIYQACGILGATVMPHSLYLGSGIVQPRLYAFDIKNGYYTPTPPTNSARTSLDEEPEETTKPAYRPSLSAIKFCLKYSIIELCVSLFTFALFVNSAILIVAGSSLSNNPSAADADIFSIHSLLSTSLSPAAGILFALALLLSGISAGVVCTIAGQMLSEGALNWSMAPWLRRLVTRSISITPSIIIAGAVGRTGLDKALNATQVVLSIVLPFVSAPLIWFTCCGRYMGVKDSEGGMSQVEVELIGHAHPEVDVPGSWRTTENGNRSTEASGHGTGSVEQGTSGSASQNGNGIGFGIENGQVHGQGVIQMRNHGVTTVFAVCIWLVIAVMNVANLVLLKNQ